MGNYEEERTMMNVRGAGHTMSMLLFMDAKIMMSLYVFLKRMYQEGILKGGEVQNYEKFMKATEGKFDIINVPEEIAKDDMVKELDALKIRYHVLPNLNEKTGKRQVAVFTEDRQKFSAWMGEKIMERLQDGGEKTVRQLNRLTDNNTSIVSIPCEGAEELQKVKADFDAMQINYTQLPDLNVGDGYTQFLVANADLKKVEHLFSLYKDDMLAKGEDIGEMKSVTPDQYVNTAEMSVEDYVATGDENVQKANEKYEGKEKGKFESWFDEKSEHMQSIENEAYEKLHNNPDYQEISIDKETLVDNCRYVADPNDKIAQQFFSSRIPGTYGSQEKILILPKEQVFRSNNGKTYLAFIKKSNRPIILNASGKPIRMENGKTGEELGKFYDPAMRKAQRTKKEALSKEAACDVGKQFAEKVPVNPMLTR